MVETKLRDAFTATIRGFPAETLGGVNGLETLRAAFLENAHILLGETSVNLEHYPLAPTSPDDRSSNLHGRRHETRQECLEARVQAVQPLRQRVIPEKLTSTSTKTACPFQEDGSCLMHGQMWSVLTCPETNSQPSEAEQQKDNLI